MKADPTRWDYGNPVRIRFGPGVLDELGDVVAGRRMGVVTTRGWMRRGLRERLGHLVPVEDWRAVVEDVAPNPSVAHLEASAARMREALPEVLVAVGGGSVLDTAKVLSVFAPLPEGAVEGHFRRNEPIRGAAPPIPVVAVPTTAGTGSEVTPFATVWDERRKKKLSLARDDLHPSVALVDPELTLTLPWATTLATGLDALAQALESVWNRNATPLTDALAYQAVSTVIESLPGLRHHPDSLERRTRLLESSLLAGLAIARTRTALAHSMSYPMTAHWGVPHGLACGFTLAALLEFNGAAAEGRLSDLARRCGYSEPGSMAQALRKFLMELGAYDELGRGIPSLDDLLSIAPEMFTPGRADNNVRDASAADVADLLRRSWSDVEVARSEPTGLPPTRGP